MFWPHNPFCMSLYRVSRNMEARSNTSAPLQGSITHNNEIFLRILLHILNMVINKHVLMYTVYTYVNKKTSFKVRVNIRVGNHFGENLPGLPKVQEFPTSVGCFRNCYKLSEHFDTT